MIHKIIVAYILYALVRDLITAVFIGKWFRNLARYEL